MLPAYIVVAVFTSIFAYFYLLPGEYAIYSYSLIASLLYASNFWFYTQSGYFSAALEFAPLLHMWSLYVEEQFYFIFPVLLLILAKVKLQTIGMLVILTLLGLNSFLLGEWLLQIDSSLSFFASPTRFWQFLAGGLLAISGVKCNSTRKENVVTSLSLGYITICFFYYSKYMPFPGINALPITLATAASLYANVQKCVFHWALANKVCLFFDNISYSLYLWHWPVIVFFKLQFLDHYTYIDMAVVFTLSLILATGTYYFIEIPFRKVNISRYQVRYITVSLTASTALSLLALLLIPVQNAPFSKQTVYLESVLTTIENDFRSGSCFLSSSFNDVTFFDKE